MVDPLLPRTAADLATTLLLFIDFHPGAPAVSSFFSVSVIFAIGIKPVVSLRKFKMVAGVIGAILGLTEFDPDPLRVLEDDADDVVR